MNVLIESLKSVLGTSWRSSSSAVASVLLCLLTLVVLKWLGFADAGTVAAIVGIILLALGQLQARDNKVSDQEAGVRPEPPKQPGA